MAPLAAVDLPSDPDDVEFVYDADGARVSRSHGDYSTIYIAGLMEIDLDTTTVTETRTFYAFAGTPVAVRTHEDPATTFVVDNHLGSFSAGWNDTDNLSSRLRYYPWGAERAPAGAPPSDHRYTGQISDDTGAASGDTGLLYYNARYYDPAVGAFVAADTIVPNPSHPGDLNRYSYVRDNPLLYTDPTGHDWNLAREAFVAGEIALRQGLPLDRVRIHFRVPKEADGFGEIDLHFCEGGRCTYWEIKRLRNHRQVNVVDANRLMRKKELQMRLIAIGEYHDPSLDLVPGWQIERFTFVDPFGATIEVWNAVDSQGNWVPGLVGWDVIEPAPNENSGVEKFIGGLLVVAGVVVEVANAVENVVTTGIGIGDDPVVHSFASWLITTGMTFGD